MAVAFMGLDGAGKSTLIDALRRGSEASVRVIYMGLHASGRRSRRWSLPGLGLGMALARQWSRWATGLYHRIRGRLVLFDRYTYDALLPPAGPLSRLGQLRRRILAHACPGPDLVVILDAPTDVLLSRKQEHSRATLERHRRALLELDRRLPRTLVVDATQPVESVAREVLTAIGPR